MTSDLNRIYINFIEKFHVGKILEVIAVLFFIKKNIINNPIFVVGSGRSGTGVLVEALNHHPGILCVRRESPIVTHLIEFLNLINDSTNKELYNYYWNSISMSKSVFYRHLKKLLYRISAGEDFGLKYVFKSKNINFFLRNSYWTTKIFPDKQQFHAIKELYLKAKFIYIFRNGINVINSRTKFHGFKHMTFEEQCKTWSEEILKYEYLLTDKSVFKIRHENLVNNTNEIFEYLFKFFKIKKSKVPGEFCISNLIHPLNLTDKSKINVRDTLKNREPAHLHWSLMNKKIFKELCSKSMKILGYDIPF